nr:MAG TPA: hypothetical protein [Caudoviricetes sp.]
MRQGRLKDTRIHQRRLMRTTRTYYNISLMDISKAYFLYPFLENEPHLRK